MVLHRTILIMLSLIFCTINCADYSSLETEDVVNKQKQRPLNILFVVGHFPSPSQIFILNIITGLIDQGHNVSIFSFQKDKYTAVHPNIIKYN